MLLKEKNVVITLIVMCCLLPMLMLFAYIEYLKIGRLSPLFVGKLGLLLALPAVFYLLFLLVSRCLSVLGRIENEADLVRQNLILSKEKKNTSYEWNMGLLRSLEWRTYEELVRDYFELAGFDSKITQDGGDGGVDIVVEKGGKLGYIQCKAWSSKVGVGIVRELFGVMSSDSVERGVLATVEGTTVEARRFAAGKHIMTLNGYDLLTLIKELPEDTQKALLSKTTRKGFSIPSCPACLQKMEKRGTNDWVCASCRTTLKQNLL